MDKSKPFVVQMIYSPPVTVAKFNPLLVIVAFVLLSINVLSVKMTAREMSDEQVQPHATLAMIEA